MEINEGVLTALSLSLHVRNVIEKHANFLEYVSVTPDTSRSSVLRALGVFDTVLDGSTMTQHPSPCAICRGQPGGSLDRNGKQLQDSMVSISTSNC